MPTKFHPSIDAPRESLADAPAPAAERFGVSVEDPARFSTHRMQPTRHNFHRHPLLQQPELARLAKELMPTRQCRFIVPGSSQTSKFDHTEASPDGRAIEEVFSRIEETGSWVALYNIESIPRYQALLAEIIDSVRPVVEREQPGIFNVGGFIFISAPPSVTPFHIDRENNFWLQIAGRKVMSVFDANDRELVPGKDVDDFIAHGLLDRVRLPDSMKNRANEFDVGPGDGVYFPSTSPHMTRTTTDWTRPGDGVSVSIGVVFYSETTRRHARVHQFNRWLRRLGVEPAMPGQSAWRDALKAPLGKALTGLRVRLGQYHPPPGAA